MTKIGPPISRDVDQRAQRNHLALACCAPEADRCRRRRLRYSPAAWRVDLPVPAEGVETVDVERAQVHFAASD